MYKLLDMQMCRLNVPINCRLIILNFKLNISENKLVAKEFTI